MVLVCAIIADILFLDQLTKFLAERGLSLNQSVPLISGVLHLTLVHNTGAAFGLFKNQLPLFIAAAIVAVTLIYRHLRSAGERRLSLYTFSLLLICAGALGNLIDRVLYGHVIDFIDLRVWPVFNVADASISIGALLLAYHLLKPQRKEG